MDSDTSYAIRDVQHEISQVYRDLRGDDDEMRARIQRLELETGDQFITLSELINSLNLRLLAAEAAIEALKAITAPLIAEEATDAP